MNDNWFYLDAQNPEATTKVGPLTKLKIESLAIEKTVQPDSMVWYPGLLSWIPWKEAAPDFPGNSPTHRCLLCNLQKPEEQMSYAEEHWVCQSCQTAMTPKTLDPLGSGPIISSKVPLMIATEQYAPFGIRLAAILVDLLILSALNAFLIIIYLFVFRIPESVIQKSLLINIPGIVLDACYQIYFLSQYGGTPGKMLFGLRVVSEDGSPLTVLHAAARYFSFWISALTLGVGFLIVLFDPQRRALHDHIAKTRVLIGPTSIR